MHFVKTITLILFLSPFWAVAQVGQLSGKVMAAGQPLEGVSLFIPHLGKGTASDRDGGFLIRNLPPTRHTVHITHTGYKSQVVAVEIVNGQEVSLDIVLEEDLLNLDQLVVTATRGEIAQYDAPAIVSTISNRTFEATQSLSMAEGLSFSPGLRLENNCQNCGFTQLRMNGLEGPYSQILINSRPIFSALAGVYGLDMLPANMVEKVEVVRGGGSALYGGNAIAGTVNIITRNPAQNTFEVGINQAFTNLEAPDRTITLNGTVVSDDLDKGISFYGYNRDRDYWDANADGFSEITLLRNNTFGFDAFLNTSSRGKIKLGAYTISEFRRGGNDFDLPAHQTDITEQLDHKILGTNLSFEQYSKDFRHKIAVYGSAQFVDRDSYYGAGGRVLAAGEVLGEEDILALNAYGKSTDMTAVAGLQYTYDMGTTALLTVGSEYQLSDVADEMPGYRREIVQQVGTLGNYAQLEWNPSDKLSFLLGGRLDHIRIAGDYNLDAERFENNRTLTVAVPRLTAMYSFGEQLKLRASFAQGYRAPQAYDEDLHIETVGGAARFIRLDPNLVTERSNSFTTSLNYGKAVGKTQINLVAEGFFTYLNNPFILSDQAELPSGVAVITKRNGEGAYVQGVNMEANFAFSKKWILQTGGTLQVARYAATEEIWAQEDPNEVTPVAETDRILRTPNAYGYATLAFNPTEKLSLSGSGIFTGNMHVAHVIDPETEQTVIKNTPSFFEGNLKASYKFDLNEGLHLQLFGGVQNLFNSFQSDFDIGPDRDAGYVYGPARPRTIFFGVKFGLQ